MKWLTYLSKQEQIKANDYGTNLHMAGEGIVMKGWN